jgi:non-heme chloroperoxidase
VTATSEDHPTSISSVDSEQVERANASGKTPVVFIHGLWLLPSSWASPVLRNPANRHRAVSLTYEQFRFGFGNAVDEDEAKELYEEFAVPAAGAPLFQAVAANLNPWTEVKVDTENADRGPLLIIAGEKDLTAPPAIANASYKKQARNDGVGVTEIVELPNRGHGLTVDGGWREVADTSLAFIQRNHAAATDQAAATV